VACTNNRRRPLYNVVCQGVNGQNIVFFEALLLDLTAATYSWLFTKAFPALVGDQLCKRIRMFVVDNDRWQVIALEGACGSPIYPNACVRLCAFHLISQPLRKLGITLQNKESFEGVKRCAWMLLSCESAQEFENLMFDLERDLESAITDKETAKCFLASLRGNQKKFAGHYFLSTVTLGVVSGSRSEFGENDVLFPPICEYHFDRTPDFFISSHSRRQPLCNEAGDIAGRSVCRPNFRQSKQLNNCTKSTPED
jgi:hypothetical protein